MQTNFNQTTSQTTDFLKPESVLTNDITEANLPRLKTVATETVITKPFRGRSVLSSQQVSPDQFKALIHSGELANDISYEVNGHVSVSNYASLNTLSGNISVMGCLFIRNCPKLRSISATLFVSGGLFIHNCPLLESVTGSVTVNQTMDINHAEGLINLSGVFTVGGQLLLMECNRLGRLSGIFSVRSDAIFSHCRRLSDMSGDFTVLGKLDLSYCNRLTTLSGTFSVGGNILLNHCTRLKSLPDWITSPGPGSSGRTRLVNLESTGLPDTLIGQLHCKETPGAQFRTSNSQTGKVFDSLQQALAFWQSLVLAQDTLKLNLQPDQAQDLLDFLEQLTNTEDYINKQLRPVLAQRVMRVITSVLMADHLREEAMAHINEATIACDNQVIEGLEELETMLHNNRSLLTANSVPVGC